MWDPTLVQQDLQAAVTLPWEKERGKGKDSLPHLLS